jgi:hypothetical protein
MSPTATAGTAVLLGADVAEAEGSMTVAVSEAAGEETGEEAGGTNGAQAFVAGALAPGHGLS